MSRFVGFLAMVSAHSAGGSQQSLRFKILSPLAENPGENAEGGLTNSTPVVEF